MSATSDAYWVETDGVLNKPAYTQFSLLDVAA